MKTFDLNIDAEISFCEKYKLNFNELFVIKALLLKQEDYPEDYLGRFLQIPEEDRGNFRDILESLQRKGIILKSYKIPNKGETFNPLDIPIHKVVYNNLCKSSFELGKELWDTYPMFGHINGGIVTLRGISKRFADPTDFFRYYSKVINWNPEIHNKIMDLIKWEQSNNVGFLNMSILAFVIEQKWIELEALKEGKISNATTNYIQSL